MTIALIPCGDSEWREQGRLLGRAELELTVEGHTECADWAAQLAGAGLSRLHHSSDDLATQTARQISRALGAPAKRAHELDELDLGLWAGLTEADLEVRYESAHHQLGENPLTVTPPDGESFQAAVERIQNYLQRRFRRDRGASIGLVVRPIVLSIARCLLEPLPLMRLWELSHEPPTPLVLERDKLPQEPQS